MLWLKIAAGLVFAIVCLAWYPFWELVLLLFGGLLIAEWMQTTASRHAEIQTNLLAIRTQSDHAPSLTPESGVAIDAARQETESAIRRQYADALGQAEIQAERDKCLAIIRSTESLRLQTLQRSYAAARAHAAWVEDMNASREISRLTQEAWNRQYFADLLAEQQKESSDLEAWEALRTAASTLPTPR